MDNKEIPTELTPIQVYALIPNTQGAFFALYFEKCPAGVLQGMFGETEIMILWNHAKFYVDAHGTLSCLLTNTAKSNSIELIWDHHTQSWADGVC